MSPSLPSSDDNPETVLKHTMAQTMFERCCVWGRIHPFAPLTAKIASDEDLRTDYPCTVARTRTGALRASTRLDRKLSEIK